jgi:hypothetical protein
LNHASEPQRAILRADEGAHDEVDDGLAVGGREGGRGEDEGREGEGRYVCCRPFPFIFHYSAAVPPPAAARALMEGEKGGRER